MERDGHDTVPPPPGEEDAYHAETRVATAPPQLLAELRALREEFPAEQARAVREVAIPRPPAMPAMERAPNLAAESAAKPHLGAQDETPYIPSVVEPEPSELAADRNIHYLRRETPSGAPPSSPPAAPSPPRWLLVLAVVSMIAAATVLAWRLL